jgi:hypothetical protein
VILIESFIDPIHFALSITAAGGTISATGVPERVTRIGVFVYCTRSRIAKQLAWNSEMAISSMITSRRPYSTIRTNRPPLTSSP